MPTHDEPTAEREENFDPLIELAAETLRGDVRDSILGWFKAAPKAWPYLSEREQRDFADAADRYARQMVVEVARVIAKGERPTIMAVLKEYREKDGIEAKLKFGSTGEVVSALHAACGREVMLVATGAEDYSGERAPPETNPDQPKLAGIGEEYHEQ